MQNFLSVLLRENSTPNVRYSVGGLPVHWFNHIRLLEPIGYIPPAEAEANYWRKIALESEEAVLT